MISNSVITFDKKYHRYVHNKTGKQFISVTTLISKYKKPFDSHYHANHVAKRTGSTKEQVLEAWENEKNKACNTGTKIHKLLEDYINIGDQVEGYGWLYKAYDNIVAQHIPYYRAVYCETLVYNETFRLAGTADLIYEHADNTFTVADFKTNKRFRFETQFNDYLLEPVDHLANCEFNVYALQMSLYAYMIEKLTGKKCRKCVAFYISGDKFEAYHINYMKSEIRDLIKHYVIEIINTQV